MLLPVIGGRELMKDEQREFSMVVMEIPTTIREDDYYEWLKDNFKSFFNHGNPDWEWIRGRLTKSEKQ